VAFKFHKPFRQAERSYRDEPFKIGLRIAKLLTYSWNLQQNPPKVHIFDRRIHHGEIGLLLGLSSLFKKYSIPAAVLTGIGLGLVKDDYDDIAEWFRFKKNVEKKAANCDYDGSSNATEKRQNRESKRQIRPPHL
jgi:hypothetical protein